MHQALALGRASQSAWHLILLFRASAEGHARVAVPRPSPCIFMSKQTPLPTSTQAGGRGARIPCASEPPSSCHPL